MGLHMQVPLLFTVYALVSFRNFRVLPEVGSCTSDEQLS